jgi:hypothetical protein
MKTNCTSRPDASCDFCVSLRAKHAASQRKTKRTNSPKTSSARIRDDPNESCPARGWEARLCCGSCEFYKKGCQEKNSASTGGREDFGLEIQPTVCKCAPSIRSRGFALPDLPFRRFHSGGDHANRVLKLGKRNRYLSVNHGSIRGSWPIAISGYPRAHSV